MTNITRQTLLAAGAGASMATTWGGCRRRRNPSNNPKGAPRSPDPPPRPGLPRRALAGRRLDRLRPAPTPHRPHVPAGRRCDRRRPALSAKVFPRSGVRPRLCLGVPGIGPASPARGRTIPADPEQSVGSTTLRGPRAVPAAPSGAPAGSLARRSAGTPTALPTAEEWLAAPEAACDPVSHPAIRVVREAAVAKPALKEKHLPRMRELAGHTDESIRRFAAGTHRQNIFPPA
jgi:hypothetical protein